MRHAGLLRKSSHAALKEGVTSASYIDLLFCSCVITDITVIKMKRSLRLGRTSWLNQKQNILRITPIRLLETKKMWAFIRCRRSLLKLPNDDGDDEDNA